jgi:hypothetical protein
MLVEAAWSAAQSAGPLRAFFLRIRDRRGQQIAAVATARWSTFRIQNFPYDSCNAQLIELIS